jgi:hypothetical protein
MPNSSKKPVNGTPIERQLQEQLETFQSTHTESKVHESEEYIRNRKKYERAIDEELSSINGTDWKEKAHTTLALEHNLRVVGEDIEEELARKGTKAFSSSVNTSFSAKNVHQRITSMGGQQEYKNLARQSNMANIPTQRLENIRSSSEQESISLGKQIYEETQNMRGSTDYDIDIYKNLVQKAGRVETQGAMATAALGIARREGTSTEKMMQRGEDIISNMDHFQAKRGINNRVATGDFKTYAEEYAKYGETEKAFKGAQLEHDKGLLSGASDKEMATFVDNLQKANVALEEQAGLVKSMASKGMDQGGGGWLARNQGKINNFVGGVGAAGNAAGAFAGVEVGNDIAEMRLKSGYMKAGNELYDQANGAVQGHSVDAMFKVMSSAQVKAYSDQAAGITQGSHIVSAGAGLITNTVSSGVKGALVSGTAGGIIGVANGVADSAVDVDAAVRNLKGGAAGLDARSAYNELTGEARYIATGQMQGYMDHNMSTYAATQGAGGSSNLQKLLKSSQTVSMLAERGVGLQESEQMAGMLKSAGAISGEASVNIMANAGSAAQRGQMNQQEYVSAASRMVAAGGSGEDLEKIIAAGMATGMDNAKNINQMVEATLSLSNNLQAGGIGSKGGMRDALGGAVQNLVASGHDANLATGMAASQMGAVNTAATDKSLSFGSLIGQQAIMNAPGMRGRSGRAVAALGTMGMDDVFLFKKAAEGKDPKAMADARTRAYDLGLEDTIYSGKDGTINKDIMGGVTTNALAKSLNKSGGAEFLPDIIQRRKAGQNLTSDQRIAIHAGGFSESTIDQMYGFKPVNNAGLTGPPKALSAEANMDAQGKERAATEYGMGEKYAGSMQNLAEAMQKVNESIDPTKWAAAVQSAANGFSVPAADFVKATNKLSVVVQQLYDIQVGSTAAAGKTRGQGATIPSGPKISGWTDGLFEL